MASAVPQPDRDRLSSMTALVLLAYGLMRVVELPSIEWQFGVLGLFVRLGFDTRTFMVLLAGALAASGSDWLVRSHPRAQFASPGLEHRVIPGMAALGAGAILNRLALVLPLATGMALSGLLLAAIFWAEFIVFDPRDHRHGWASLGLRTLSLLLFVGTVFTIRAAGVRAIFAIPLIFLACSTYVWRLLKLEGFGGQIGVFALTIAWLVSQMAWGLHYWPLSPAKAALVLAAAAYLGSGFASAHLVGRLDQRQLLELGLLGLASLAAILIAA